MTGIPCMPLSSPINNNVKNQLKERCVGKVCNIRDTVR